MTTIVNDTIYDEDPHLEIGDMVHGYCTVSTLNYFIIIYIYWGGIGHSV